jgi:Holliday junction resolvase
LAQADDTTAIQQQPQAEGETMTVPWNEDNEPEYMKQERKPFAGTRKQPNSGRSWRMKGDRRGIRGVAKGLMVDCKTTRKNSYRISKAQWEEFKMFAARDLGARPAMRLDINGLDLTVLETSLVEEWIRLLDDVLEKL